MKRILFLCLFLPLFGAYGQLIKSNALAMRNGCRIVEGPQGLNKQKHHDFSIKNLTANAIIDENYTTGWCSPRQFSGQRVFVFELSENYVIDELKFHNSKDPTYYGLNAKEVTVEYSTKSAYSGYDKVGTFILTEHGVTDFNLQLQEARYIRITIDKNYGNSEYTELMEVEALGYFKSLKTPVVNLKGHWKTNWGDVVLNENDHGLLYGCYKHNHGELVAEGINRRTINFKWAEPKVNVYGWAIVVLNNEGDAMHGIWGYEDGRSDIGFLNFKHTTEAVEHCRNDKLLSEVYPELHNNEIRLKISLHDNHDKTPVSGRVELIGDDGSSYLAFANGKGELEVNVHKNANYELKIINNSYYTINEQFHFSKYEMRYQAEIEKTFNLKKLEVGFTFNLKNLMFEQGNTNFAGNSFRELDKLVRLLREHPNMRIQLSGHTDNTGSEKANLKLSQSRVDKVKLYLTSYGINPHRIKGIGYGGKVPIASNSSEQTRKLNRRVEMKILKL